MSKLTKRITALLLSGMLVIGSVPGSIFAASTDVDPGQTSEIAQEVYEEDTSEAPAGEGEMVEIEETSEVPMGAGETAESAGEMSETAETSETPADGEESLSEEATAEEEAAVQFYTVTLDANGGYFENEWDDAIGDYAQQAEVIEKHIPVDGTVAAIPVFVDPDGQAMLFAGWSLERDGELVTMGDEEYAPVDNCVLYAVWKTEDTSLGETAEQEVVDDGTEKADSVKESEEVEVEEDSEGEVTSEESPVEEDTVFDSNSDSETENEQDITSDQETVSADEDVENISDDATKAEGEIQPELIETAEEETVSEDAANGEVAGGTCGDNLTWTLDEEGTLTISGTGEKYSFIYADASPWYTLRSKIKRGVISNGVTAVGNEAFDGCENLTSVEIANSVTTIGEGAFYKCTSLGEISIPNSVTVIKRNAFYGCGQLSNIEITDSVVKIGSFAFNGTPWLNAMGDLVIFNHILLRYTGSSTSFTIPDGVKMIGADAFYRNQSLQSITIPAGVEEIWEFAFSGCNKLTEVELPEGVTCIEQWAFASCSGMTKIKLPNSVISIGGFAFYNCTNLSNVSIPKNVKKIDTYAFSNCTSFTDIAIPKGIQTLSGGLFNGCSNLASVRIPKSVTEIENWAFKDCSSLKDIYYEGSEEEWGKLTIGSLNNDPLSSATVHFNSLITGTIEMEPKILRAVGETFTISAVYKGQNIVSSASADSDAGGALQVGEVDIWDPVDNGDEIETNMYFQVTAVTKGRYNLTLTTDDGTEATVTVEIISNDIADAEVQLDGVYKNENGYDCFEYTGFGILPTVAKVTLDGVDLVIDQDFTISYGENTDAGFGIIKLSGKGSYEGIKRVIFIILPQRVSGLKIRDDICTDETHDTEHIHGKIGVEWDETSASDGYYIEISSYPEFYEITTEKKAVNAGNTANYEDTVPRKAGSKWYVRAAAFVTINGKKLVGEWSDPLPVTICHHFLLNRDTNQFSHDLPSFFKGEWVTKEDGTKEYVPSEKAIYATSEEYYNRLLEGHSDPSFFRYLINKRYLEEWNGSCHGMSTAMALSGFGKKLGGVETVFWNCDMPKNNIALRNMINYYQLAFNCYPFTKEAMSGVFKVRELVYSNEVALHDLLQSLAEEGMRSEREGKAFVLSMSYKFLDGGHSVIVFGADRESDTRYRLKVFDKNWFDNTVGGDLEEEEIATTELIIDLANDTFSCTLPFTYPDVVISEDNYFSIGYLGIDDLHGDNAVPQLRAKSVSGKSNQDFATLEVSAAKDCTITNEAGETLILKEGSVTGTMAVYDVRVIGEKTLYYEFKVDRSDFFTLSDMQSEISITADIGHKFHTATANGADTIRLSEGKVEILGINYAYDAGLSTGLSGADMVICGGHASNDLVLEADGETAEFRTEGENTCKFRFINGVSQEIREYTNLERITVTDTDAAGFAKVAADDSEEIIGVASDDPWGTGHSTTHSGNLSSTAAWKLNESGVLTVFGKGAIPNSSSPEWQDYKDDIQKIVLRDGITSVGSDAFKDCKSCRSVSIPESVYSIRDRAFSGCNALEELDWIKASSVMKIGDEVFLDCDSLCSVVIPEGVYSLGDYAFARCDQLKSVIIPDTVLFIGDYVFTENDSLENVQMGTKAWWKAVLVGIEGVGGGFTYPEGLFSNCPSLKTVTIPEGHRNVFTSEFENCESLQSITLPKTLERIRDNAFKNCGNLTTVIYNGTREEWKALNIDNGNIALERCRVECSDGSLMLVTALSVTLPSSAFTYTGKAITPEVTLKDGSIMLKKGTDYEVTYTDNTNIGTATVTITGKGNYTGTVNKTFTISAASIANATVSGISNKTYTGSALKQNPTVKVGDQTLTKDTDYTVSYANNTKVGTATVKITGKGNYTGTVSKTFTITPASIANATVSGISNKTYTGSALTQNPTVKVGDKTLTKNTDYTVSYQNNTNVGTATVTITGKGNYASKKNVTFKINKAAQSITAKAKASRVAVGKTTTVSITGNKGSKSYKSSNTAIATVDSSTGKVTAKKVGTVKITATSAATANYNAASKTVTIKIVPAATASLAAANQVKGIKLTWKKVTGANGYIVYRNNKKVKTITSGATVTWADTKANTNGTKYTYKVLAKATTGDSTLSKSRVIYRVSRPAVSSVTNSASKKMAVKWGKNAKANGYQIQYSTDKTFKTGNKAVTVTGASTVSKVIGNLTKGKTYYVRIRTYKTVGSTKYWSIWSAARSVKISK